MTVLEPVAEAELPRGGAYGRLIARVRIDPETEAAVDAQAALMPAALQQAI
jgi:hypothetical protein